MLFATHTRTQGKFFCAFVSSFYVATPTVPKRRTERREDHVATYTERNMIKIKENNGEIATQGEEEGGGGHS